MIPKIIHYCWFGRKPLPDLAQKCIASWRKYLPDYEIREWNEDNFDVNIIPYTSEAYGVKKFAFVSDYARFWILYKYGGLYFDTDVEVVRPMDDIIARGPFMGRESENDLRTMTIGVNPGLGLGAPPGLGLYKKILDYYGELTFCRKDGSHDQTTVVEHVSKIMIDSGINKKDDWLECSGILIYPKEYLCPMDYDTGKIVLTENTYTIHHYMASWLKPKDKLKKRVQRFLGHRLTNLVVRMKKILKLAHFV